MSIFGSIMSAIIGSATAAAKTVSTTLTQGTSALQPAVPTPIPMSEVDVATVLNSLAAKNPEKLDWRRSIVDLMKLLKLDSSLTARKLLAQELHFTGDTNDSASMNIWLHKQVMQKLAENGGKVPADLRS